jgi:hypothetical protein
MLHSDAPASISAALVSSSSQKKIVSPRICEYAKINFWSDDAAAYAVIWRVRFMGGGAAIPGGDDWAAHPSVGLWKNIDKVEFKLYLYGPIKARASILGFYM